MPQAAVGQLQLAEDTLLPEGGTGGVSMPQAAVGQLQLFLNEYKEELIC